MNEMVLKELKDLRFKYKDNEWIWTFWWRSSNPFEEDREDIYNIRVHEPNQDNGNMWEVYLDDLISPININNSYKVYGDNEEGVKQLLAFINKAYAYKDMLVESW